MIKFINQFKVALAADLAVGATTLSLADASKLVFDQVGDYYILTLIKSGTNDLEIVKATAKAGNVVTVVRAQEGTTALALLAGDAVENRVTAGSFVIFQDYISGSVGVIRLRASSNLGPREFECNGQNVSRIIYANLFAEIGTTWGEGNGTTTFTLPDLRGKFVRGWDHGHGNDPNSASRTAQVTGGSGTGNAGDNVGSIQGHALENITGKLDVRELSNGTGLMANNSGALKYTFGTGPNSGERPQVASVVSRPMDRIEFNADLVAATSTETRGINAYVMYVIIF